MRISDWSSDVCSSDLHADGAARGRTRTGGEHQRQRPRHGGDRGHQDRPEPAHRGNARRLQYVMPLVAELIGELDYENPVLGGQTDEHDDPDLAGEVEGLPHERQADHPARPGRTTGSYDATGMGDAL